MNRVHLRLFRRQPGLLTYWSGGNGLRTSGLSTSHLRLVTNLSKHQGSLDIRRVRVSPRRLTWKRVGTLTLAVGLSCSVLWTVLGALAFSIDDTEDVGIVKQQLEDASKGDKLSIDGEDGLEMDGKGPSINRHQEDLDGEEFDDEIPQETPEDAWFIPLWFAKKLPPTYYGSGDLEWQAFMKIASDRQRQQEIKNELCRMILRSLKENKHVERALGEDIKCKSYWLDIDYPPGPPPSYERYGIEWADEYIALLHRPVNATTVRRVEKALWPSAVMMSAYATLKDLVQLQYTKIRKAVGWNDDQSFQKAGELISISKESASNANETAHQPSSLQATGSVDVNIVSFLSILPDYPQDDWRIRSGLALFRRKLSKAWRPASSTPPAGSIILQGLIEYRGSSALCTIEVAAAYVATESKWHLVMVNVKRVRPNIQRPRGTSWRNPG